MMKLNNTFSRFLIVGLINTIVGTSVMFIAYNALDFSYWVSTFLNYFIGSIVSYFLNKYYTFQSKQKSMMEIVRFIINIAICYFLAYYLAAKAVAFIFASYSQVFIDNISMIVGMCFFVFLNYFGQRLIVFKK